MKIQLLVSILSVVLHADGVASQLTPKARHLTIEEVMAMVTTETPEDYEWTEEASAQANALWDTSIAYEWARQGGDEANGAENYPYIFCNNHEGMSGYQRSLELIDATDADANNLRTLYNGDEIYCCYGHVLPSSAASVEGDQFIVNPVVPSMKFMGDLLNDVEHEIVVANLENNTFYRPVLNVLLCPGVNSYADIEEKDWNSRLTEILSEQVYPSQLSEAFFLTSQEYINLTETVNATNATQRAVFWKSILDKFHNSDECAEIYNERLTFSLEKGSNITGLSLFEIFFNTTGISQRDQGCMLTLALAIAVMPDSCSIELRRQPVILNTEAQWVVQGGAENERPFFDVGLDGTGQVVAVSDTGIDMNNCYFLDPEHEIGKKINLEGRQVIQYVPFVNDDDYRYGHGTHVAGSVAGKRLDSPGAADGVAPGAKIAFMDVGDKIGNIMIPTYEELLDTGRPYANFHSVSWGTDKNKYTTETSIFDQYMYENDDFLILVAGGNVGQNDEWNTVGEPATGKNILAVGSHHNEGTSADGFGKEYASGWSSRGPTKDGRTKPDVLAPGEFILSAGALPNEVGECDPADGYIPPPKSEEDGLASFDGTSMAAPVAAGAAAIVRQYFTEGYYPTGTKNNDNAYSNPSSALVKAVLMNGAQYMIAVDNKECLGKVEPYDQTQNFGRISLLDSIYLAGKSKVQLQVFDREVVLDGETNTYNLKIDRSDGCLGQAFSVTLYWNEEGSSPGCEKCLLNDLNLLVERDGDEFYPNGLNKADKINNNERVIVDDAADGDMFVVTVEAKNLHRDTQRYALVATGCFGGVMSPISFDAADISTDAPGDSKIDESPVDDDDKNSKAAKENPTEDSQSSCTSLTVSGSAMLVSLCAAVAAANN